MKRRMPVFVGCEGDSERAYVRWLQSRLDELGLSVHLDSYIGGGGDPLAVVQSCVKECLRRQKLYGAFTVRAIFLDTDKMGEDRSRDNKIPAELRRGNINAVFQVFDHEALLLRHFAGQHTKRPGKRRSLAALKKVWPNYQKPADAKQLARYLDLASLQRALRVEKELQGFLVDLGFPKPPVKRKGKRGKAR